MAQLQQETITPSLKPQSWLTRDESFTNSLPSLLVTDADVGITESGRVIPTASSAKSSLLNLPTEIQ
jgi:hypothetical protein